MSFYLSWDRLKRKIGFYVKEYPKMSKVEKEKRRQYYKTCRTFKKRLYQNLKGYGPWDYGWMLDTIKIMIEHWCEYYKLGYNVDAQEVEGGVPSRLEIAEKLRELYKNYEDAQIRVEEWCKEEECLKEFFDYLAKYILYMWD